MACKYLDYRGFFGQFLSFPCLIVWGEGNLSTLYPYLREKELSMSRRLVAQEQKRMLSTKKNSLLLFVSGTEEEDNSQCELLSVQISSATLNSFAFSTTSGKELKNVPCKKQFFRYSY